LSQQPITTDQYDGLIPQSGNSQPAPGPSTGATNRKEQRMKAKPTPTIDIVSDIV
jgi:hypothetical protein